MLATPWSTLTHKTCRQGGTAMHILLTSNHFSHSHSSPPCHHCSTAVYYKIATRREEAPSPLSSAPSLSPAPLLDPPAMSPPPTTTKNGHKAPYITEIEPDPTSPPLSFSPPQSELVTTSQLNPKPPSSPLPSTHSLPQSPTLIHSSVSTPTASINSYVTLSHPPTHSSQSSSPLSSLNPPKPPPLSSIPSPPPSSPSPSPSPSKSVKGKAKEGEQEVKEIMDRLGTDQPPPPPVKKFMRVSNERVFHGKEFDSRVHALRYLLTSSHCALLLRMACTTHEQATQLLAVAQEFGFVDRAFLYALQKFYMVRADVPETLRVVELLRAYGIPYSEREKRIILRAQRRARLFTEGTLRGDVIRLWARIGDADMCMRCYENMRAAGTHPGEPGFEAMLRMFRARGEDATCARLLEDMSTVGFDRLVFAHRNAQLREGKAKGKNKGTEAAEGDALAPDDFKTLLRYHAELAEEDVCTRLVQEMRARGIEEDSETQEIVDSIQEKIRDEQELDPSPPYITNKQRTPPPRIPPSSIPSPPRAHPSRTPTNPTAINAPLPEFIPPTLAPSPVPSPIPTFPPPPLPSKSVYETEMERWATMKEDKEIPTQEFIYAFLRTVSREGDGDTCEELLAAMSTHGIARTAEAYACVIEARKGDPARCEALFTEMRAQQISPTLPVYNTMLWVYCAQRKNEDAFALFEEMRDIADTISYNTLMRVYAGDGNLQSVMRLSAQMKERGIAHDAATYTIMVELLGRFGMKGMVIVDAVFREIEEKSSKIQPDVLLYDTLMDVYGGVGNWVMCERVWKSIKGRVAWGEASAMRFLQRHCHKDPSIYVKWKKEFSNFLPP